jgi:hypothetical protein
MYKQETPTGCGLYAVANALNLPKKFITDERLQATKRYGNNTGQLSAWLQESGYPVYIEVLHYNQERGLSDKAMKIKPEEGNKLPVLLVLQPKADSDMQHMVAGLIDADGKLTVMDSLVGVPTESTMHVYSAEKHKVFAMYAFARVKDGLWLNF